MVEKPANPFRISLGDRVYTTFSLLRLPSSGPPAESSLDTFSTTHSRAARQTPHALSESDRVTSAWNLTQGHRTPIRAEPENRYAIGCVRDDFLSGKSLRGTPARPRSQSISIPTKLRTNSQRPFSRQCHQRGIGQTVPSQDARTWRVCLVAMAESSPQTFSPSLRSSTATRRGSGAGCALTLPWARCRWKVTFID
jgi:hypothetical protein